MPNRSDRWWEVRRLTEEGWTAAEIADHLHVSESTVTRVRANIREVLASGSEQPFPPGAVRSGNAWIDDADWELVKAGKLHPKEAQDRWRRSQAGS